MDDERYYEVVAREVARGDVRPGLWAKALSLSAGDDKAAKALYLKLRVEQIRDLASSEEREATKHAISDSAKTTVDAFSRFIFRLVGLICAVAAFASVMIAVLVLGGPTPGADSSMIGTGLLLGFLLGCLAYWCFRTANVFRRARSAGEPREISRI